MKSIIVKNSVYYLFLILLALPLMQKSFQLFKEAPLQGDFYTKKWTGFTFKTWFNGQYHIEKEAFIDENFGFRISFVRLNNQLLFSLFNIAKAHEIIIGKENYLFGTDYIKSYTGEDFIGDEKIKKSVNELSLINDELKKRGKIFLILIAPNKCYYYPEYLPDKFSTPGDSTNYKSYLKYLSKSNILFIDFNAWLMAQKHITNYLLYPKTGIHWSNYSAALAAASVVKYLRKNATINIAGFSIEGVELSDWAKNPDQDIEDGCNLLFRIDKPKQFAYPIIKADDAGRKKPKAFIVSDSYYWNWSWYGLDTMMFKTPFMGYYYNDVYNISAGRDVINPVSYYGINSLIDQNEIIILMTTEGKLQSFPWGFIEEANRVLFGKADEVKKEEFIRKIIVKIKMDNTWAANVAKKAQEKKLSIDEMLRLDAEYVVNKDYKNLVIEDYIEKIHNDKERLKLIEQKAKDKNIPLDEMIKQDAAWMAEHENSQ